MRFPPSLLDDIRARLPVSAVVGKHVKLVRAGREWKGLSPFKAERTPSFYVNDQKGFYHCFASGEHGDIFAFLVRIEGLAFPEAVERLAAQAGVELPKFSPEAAQREEARKGLHEAIELATRFFEAQLRSSAGGEARKYLAGRDLPAEVQQQFRLGFAPAGRHALRDHLAEKGVGLDVMIEAGLLISGEDIPVPYDRFRDRVIFPISDTKGRVIAFGGRAMRADQQPKYLNSSDTPLFQKGRVLYNHHQARKAAHESGSVIAVEGYIDVIAMTRAGLAQVVAPLGTALTGDQLDLLWRMAPEPILCFDGDAAGRRAAYRAIDVVMPKLLAGRSLRFAFLPDGQDPDDLLRSSGPEALRQALAQPLPLFDVIWTRELERGPLDTPERRADFERRLREIALAVGDETLRRHYRGAFEERLRGFLAAEARGQRGPAARRQRFDPRLARPMGENAKTRAACADLGSSLKQSRMFSGAGRGALPREAALVLAVINHPELLDMHAETFAGLALRNLELERLRRVTLGLASGDGMLGGRTLRESVADRLGAGSLSAAEALLHSGDFWAGQSAALADVLQGWSNAADLHERASTLNTELRLAAVDLVDSGTDESLARVQALTQRLHTPSQDDETWDSFGLASGRAGHD